VKRKPKLPEGEELGADWERWAKDHRPRRLKRKRDFDDVDPLLVEIAAQNGAERLGKAVRTFPDPYFADKFIWVQFADHKVVVGRPCPCGSRRVLRLHPHFGRCGDCGAQLLLKEKGESTALYLLRELTDVHLERVDLEGKRDVYRGYGLNGKRVNMVIAEFRQDEGEELTPENVFDRIEKTRVLKLEHLEGMIDTEALLARDDSEWDLVFSGDGGDPEVTVDDEEASFDLD
jgi:DNA-directed RNA polymerase subunit RPC12/RpoP